MKSKNHKSQFKKIKNMSAILAGVLFIGLGQSYAVADSKKASGTVLTKEDQASMTPDSVITLLKDGNKRFLAETMTKRDHSEQVLAAIDGQFPKAFILSCVDSRVPAEDIFDLGLGDVFVGRVAGNFENTDLLGSMEFAHKVSGAKVLLVLGHESCGAVKAAVDNVELGNITPMLENITPAVKYFTNYKGVKTSKNNEFVNMVIERNVVQTIEDIRKNSPILAKMEKDDQIKIVGAYYELKTGKVTFLK